MTTHFPTIQELNRKGVRELHTIVRSAARKTQDNIRRVLAARHPRP